MMSAHDGDPGVCRDKLRSRTEALHRRRLICESVEFAPDAKIDHSGNIVLVNEQAERSLATPGRMWQLFGARFRANSSAS